MRVKRRNARPCGSSPGASTAVASFPPSSQREIAECVLAELSARDLLSDARFAQDYVRARIACGYGPERIYAELREWGIDNAIIQQCIDLVDRA